jgi:hypothetical protein
MKSTSGSTSRSCHRLKESDSRSLGARLFRGDDRRPIEHRRYPIPEEQIGKTVDTPNHDRLYSLLGQEVEREMMARNREQFGFRVIDSPRVPDQKSGPVRNRAAAAALMFSWFVFAIYFVARDRLRQTKEAVSEKGEVAS